MIYEKINLKDITAEELITKYCSIWKNDECVGITDICNIKNTDNIDARPILLTEDLTKILSTRGLDIIMND